MQEHKPLYPWSSADARRLDEHDLWVQSHNENCICAREIEQAIEKNHRDDRVSTDFVKDIIKKFGFDRVNWVLANTVREGMDDGRYTPDNKKWAQAKYIPKEDSHINYKFAVNAHPCLVNGVVSRVRKEWQNLGLYDKSHCYEESLNFQGKVAVLRPDVLEDEYKKPEYQLFYASTGFGCDPHASGTKVFGQFLFDGDKTRFCRGDFIGVLKLDLLPDWAKEKYAALSSKDKQVQKEEIAQDTEQDSDKTPKMGGLQ